MRPQKTEDGTAAAFLTARLPGWYDGFYREHRKLHIAETAEETKMTREGIMTIIENELRTMDTMSLRIVWAFIRGIKKRSRKIDK